MIETQEKAINPLSPKIKLMITMARLVRKILGMLEGQIPATAWTDLEEQVERAERIVALAALNDARRPS